MNPGKIDYNAPKFAVFGAYIGRHLKLFLLDMFFCLVSSLIALIEKHHILEQGTGAELLEKNGAYAALERAQEMESEKRE